MNSTQPKPPDRSAPGLSDPRPLDSLRRRPLLLARFELLRFRRMWRSLRGPAAVLTWTNPLWVVPIAVYAQYAQIYALALALDEIHLGYLASVGAAGAVVFYLVGGWLTDRLGYKRCIMIFDTLSWPLPMVVLALATSPWHFYLAAAMMSSNTAVVPAWHALFVSGVAPERRGPAYGMLFLVLTAPGVIFPLLGGWLVGYWGLVPAMRGTYAAAAGLMLLGVIIRWRLLPATASREGPRGPLAGALLDQFRPYLRMIRHPRMRAFLLALTLTNLDVAVGMSFVPVYVMNYLGVGKAAYSLVPTVASCVRLASILLLAPRLTPRNTKVFFLSSAIFLLAGSAVFALLLAGPETRAPLLATVIAATVLWAIGGALSGPSVIAQWTNMVPEGVRSRLWGAHGAVQQGLAVAGTAVAGHAYAAWPYSLILGFLLLEVGAVVCFAVSPVGTASSPRLAEERMG